MSKSDTHHRLGAWVDHGPALLLIGLFGALLLLSTLIPYPKSVGLDELNHLDYATRLLDGQSERRLSADDSKMPITLVNAWLPAALGWDEFLDRGGEFLYRVPLTSLFHIRLPQTMRTAHTGLTLARLPGIAFAMALAFLVYAWSRSLHGRGGGLLSLCLLVLSPTLLGHAPLVGTDVPLAVFAAFSLYAFCQAIERPSFRWTLALGLLLGLALISKFSGILLLPILGACFLGTLFAPRATRDARGARLTPARVAFHAALSVIVCLGVVSAASNPKGLFQTLKAYSLKSRTFTGVQDSVLGGVPLPLPASYIQGFDWVKERSETGYRVGALVLFDESRDHTNCLRSDMGVPYAELHRPVAQPMRPFRGYYLVALAVKMPIPTLLTLLATLVILARRWRRLRFAEVVLGAWALGFLALSMTNPVQIGVRHLAPILPAAFILAGCVWPALPTLALAGRRRAILVAVGGAWLLLSVLRFYPEFVPYANAFVGPRHNLHRVLADSNIEWGTAKACLRRYLADHPEVQQVDPTCPAHGPTRFPFGTIGGADVEIDGSLRSFYSGARPGAALADANMVRDVFCSENSHSWLYGLEPTRSVCGGFLLYELTEEDIDSRCSR